MDIAQNEQVLRAFADGSVVGLEEPGIQPKRLKTWISHVFIYDSTVYKVYQHDNYDFNKKWRDIGDPEVRKWFYGEDFYWNRYFNEEVYQELLGIKIEGDTVRIVEKTDNPDDLVIKMKRINADHNLTWQLREGQLTEEGAETVGREMTKLIAEFPKKPESSWDFGQYMASRLDDMLQFCYLAEKYLPRNEAEGYMRPLHDYFNKNKDLFESLKRDDMVIGVDNHSDNVFYNGGHASFIDIYQVKENWLLVSAEYNIFRLNADVLVLGGEKLSKALLHGYYGYYKIEPTDPLLALFYTINGAIIKGAYLQILDKPGEAKPYWDYVKANIDKLGQA